MRRAIYRGFQSWAGLAHLALFFCMKKIEKLIAVLAEENGVEGIMGTRINGEWLPLVSADVRLIKKVLPLVKLTGVKYRVVEFSYPIDVTDYVGD